MTLLLLFATPAVALSVVGSPAVSTWVAKDASVSSGGVSVTGSAAVSAWTAKDGAITLGPVSVIGGVSVTTWVARSAAVSVGPVSVGGLPSNIQWIPLDGVVTGGSSSSGGTPGSNGGRPGEQQRFKIPGYVAGSGFDKRFATEFQKIQRAQSNSDTVLVNGNYTLQVIDRMLLIDTSIGDVTISLLPASFRFELPILIAKISRDFNHVRVVAVAGDSIGDGTGLDWTDPFVAYSMHPDGTNHWWLEGVHDEITVLNPGTFVTVNVNKRGKVTGGTSASGDPNTYLDGEGKFSTPVNYAMGMLFMARN